MNCFTHALPHLDDPYFSIGVCLPDWLSACDRKCRVREKKALAFIDHEDETVATVARGVVQHHRDDDWFHRTPVFNELILNFAVELRELFENDRTMRPSLIGHIVVEMFLDAYLHDQNPGRLDYFYQQVETVDAFAIEDAVNLFATRPTDKLADEIDRFCRARYLFDYESNEGTAYRINQVMKGVSIGEVDDRILEWLPNARERVYNSVSHLLPNYPIEIG